MNVHITDAMISELLRDSLERAGLTQRSAASLLGITNQYLNDILHGRRRITPPLAYSWSVHIEPELKNEFWQSLCILGAEADGWSTDAILNGRREYHLLRELLKRIRDWDQLPLTTDGNYWIAEIDKVLG